MCTLHPHKCDLIAQVLNSNYTLSLSNSTCLTTQNNAPPNTPDPRRRRAGGRGPRPGRQVAAAWLEDRAEVLTRSTDWKLVRRQTWEGMEHSLLQASQLDGHTLAYYCFSLSINKFHRGKDFGNSTNREAFRWYQDAAYRPDASTRRNGVLRNNVRELETHVPLPKTM